jgi:hypothetical protein
MLKIQRKTNGGVIFTLSGRIEATDLDELRRLLELEGHDSHIALDLRDVTLVDRDAIRYLADCEADGTQLANCPPYVRKWIGQESGPRPKKQHPRTAKPRKREQRNELE